MCEWKMYVCVYIHAHLDSLQPHMLLCALHIMCVRVSCFVWLCEWMICACVYTHIQCLRHRHTQMGCCLVCTSISYTICVCVFYFLVWICEWVNVWMCECARDRYVDEWVCECVNVQVSGCEWVDASAVAVELNCETAVVHLIHIHIYVCVCVYPYSKVGFAATSYATHIYIHIYVYVPTCINIYT